MKSFIISACLLVLLSACSKKSNPPGEEPDPHPRQAGTPIQGARGAVMGSAVTASIGTAGGTLRTPDGRVTIIVPAGAVATAQTFSIQQVENTLRPGSTVSHSFRLLPENVTFAKPVAVSVKYDPAAVTSGTEDVLRLAYQTPEGRWKTTRAALNKTTKTLNVHVFHFCDFTFYDQFEMFFDKKELGKGEMARISVGYIWEDNDNEDLLAPLQWAIADEFDGGTGKHYAELSHTSVSNVKNWKIVRGGGTLIPEANHFGVNANARYTAPANITKLDSAIVEVTLEGLAPIKDSTAPGGYRTLGTLIIRKSILLVPEGYILLRVNGKDHLFSEGLTGQVLSGLTGIGGNYNKGEMGIAINIGSTVAGAYSCENPQANNGKAHVTWVYKKGDVPLFASSTYCVEEGGAGVPKYSGGIVKLMKIGQMGDFLEGEFNGTLYEPNTNSETCEFEQKQVNIKFRVKRTL